MSESRLANMSPFRKAAAASVVVLGLTAAIGVARSGDSAPQDGDSQANSQPGIASASPESSYDPDNRDQNPRDFSQDSAPATAEALPSPSPTDIAPGVGKAATKALVENPKTSPSPSHSAHKPAAKPATKQPIAQAPKPPAPVSTETRRIGHTETRVSNTEAARLIAADSATFANASGNLVRNRQGNPIGVTSVGRLFDGREFYLGKDGEQYMVSNLPLLAKTGHVIGGDQQVAGEVKTIFLSSVGDPYSDFALGAFEGQSEAEVVELYSLGRLTPNQVMALAPGTKIFASGYTIIAGAQETHLQSAELEYIGFKDVVDAQGKVIKMALASTDETNPFNQLGGNGASGGNGFIMVNGVRQSVGNISNYTALTGPDGAEQRERLEKRFGISLAGKTGVIGLSYEAPIDLQRFRVVRNVGEIVGGVDSKIEPTPRPSGVPR